MSTFVASAIFQSCATVMNFMDPTGPGYYGTYSTGQLFDDEVKVVSYNIAWAKNVNQAINELTRFPDLKDADIILLQEMDQISVEKMAQSLGYNFVYYPGSIHNIHAKDIGNAILSIWPMSNGKKLIFPHKQSWNDRIRTATVATVDINGLKIRTYNVHTATVLMNASKKLDQLESVVSDVSDEYDYVIIGGDFNTAWPGSIKSSSQLFEKAGFVRATQNAGFTARAFGVLPITLDHIFSKGLSLIECGKVEFAQASDHLPLWASFAL